MPAATGWPRRRRRSACSRSSRRPRATLGGDLRAHAAWRATRSRPRVTCTHVFAAAQAALLAELGGTTPGRALAIGATGDASAAASLEAGAGLVLGHEGRRLGAALQVQLREDRADVVLDGLVREEDLGRDLLVGLALRDQQQDLLLLRGQLGQLVGVGAGGDAAHPLEHLLGDRRVEQRFAAADRLERRDEVARPDLLEQVAAGAGDDGREHGLLVGIAGEHHDAGLGMLGADLAARLDARSRRAGARP